MSKSFFSLLNWGIVCAVILLAFAPSLITERDGRTEPPAALSDHWEIGFGSARPGTDGWLPIDDALAAALENYEGTLWLRRDLPEMNMRNPHLFLILLNRFEVFLDETSLYRYNLNNESRYINPLKTIHSIPVAPRDEGKSLLIRSEWHGEPLYNYELLTIGEPEREIVELIRAESLFWIYGMASLAAGIVGTAVWIWNRKRLYGWFALFSLSVGFGLLFSCRSLQWFIELEQLYYWQELLILAAVWTCVGFFFNALEVRRRALIRTVHASAALYCTLAVAAAIGLPELFARSSGVGNAAAAVAGLAILAFAIWTEPPKPDHLPERKWLIRGYLTFAVCATASLIVYTLPGWTMALSKHHLYFSRVVSGLLPNGLLLLMICLVMAIIARVRRVYEEAERNASELRIKHEELEDFHRNLERLVEIRTAELESANRTVDMTLNEKAETMAELSVLEERGRVADAIHDVVGHTLTAAIVQLEATKKLAEKQERVPMEKLDLLSELMRKGLDDIRKAVMLVKMDEARPLTLEASLRELIQYTEDTTSIDIAADITLPAEIKLDKRIEQVVYDALQEGLASGPEQGGRSSVRISLRPSGNRLFFRLVRDGEPGGAPAPGYGLSSVLERVKLLGGKADILPDLNADGISAGLELSIDLPLG